MTKAGSSSALCNMNLISDDFIGEHITNKAKTYDFLPIAYNSELLANKVKSEFTEAKLNA